MQELELQISDMVINTKKKLVLIKGKPLELTRKEYGILEYLALHKNCIISAECLIEHIWDSEAVMFSNTFKFHMSSLKKKIADLTPVELIRNIRGQGYIMED
jgi:DNA-binding response OmpR family regulator